MTFKIHDFLGGFNPVEIAAIVLATAAGSVGFILNYAIYPIAGVFGRPGIRTSRNDAVRPRSAPFREVRRVR